jgi:hypothetical protein
MVFPVPIVAYVGMRRLLKPSRLLSLRVPRKSPRKYLSVQVDDKIRVTVMIVPT